MTFQYSNILANLSNNCDLISDYRQYTKYFEYVPLIKVFHTILKAVESKLSNKTYIPTYVFSYCLQKIYLSLTYYVKLFLLKMLSEFLQFIMLVFL